MAKAPDPIDILRELKGTCSFTDGIEFVDDYGSGHVILVDSEGRSLKFILAGSAAYVALENGSKVKLVPGSHDEQHLLAIMRASFMKAFNPPFTEEPHDPKERDRFWTQMAVRHFISILEYRCTTKKEAT